ncbi:MAG: molybdenum cofactor guanylyltransferase [Actinomycetia bacterium]|nr:molybdenum cofactor guanylyltransferase [Actinomycetes bacterium]
MGRDKALLPVAGTAMAVLVADALRAGGCDPVVAIGGDPDALGRLGLTTIADRWPGEGPLGGVITALEHFDDLDAVVVAACDLPRLSSTTVAALVSALTIGTDVAMAVTDRQQPLCAAWRPSAAVHLSAMFAVGGRRLLDALGDLRVVDVSVAESQLINVNTAADLPG